MNFFVDDAKDPKWYGIKDPRLVVYRSGEAALEAAQKMSIEVLYLDHDLGRGMNGYDLLVKLVDVYNIRPRAVVIISLNPEGIKRIREYCQIKNIRCQTYSLPSEMMIDGQSG